MSSSRCFRCVELIVKMPKADRGCQSGSSESPGDVRFGALVRRAGEHPVGGPDLDEPAEVEERRRSDTRAACCKLCVTMMIVSSRLSSYSSSSTFCVAIGSSALAGSSSSRHLGLVGQRARDAQPLLLPAGEPKRALAQPILHFVPQRRAPERRLDDRVEIASGCECR